MGEQNQNNFYIAAAVGSAEQGTAIKFNKIILILMYAVILFE